MYVEKYVIFSLFYVILQMIKIKIKEIICKWKLLRLEFFKVMA